MSPKLRLANECMRRISGVALLVIELHVENRLLEW